MEATTEKLSLPIEFQNKMKALLGDEWEAFLRGYEDDNYRALRFNPNKKGFCEDKISEYLSKLGQKELVGVPWEKWGYYYENELRPGKHPYHEAGVYYIQEPSAMSAASLLAPKPGMRVLDLCAAPGGKSTQLAGYLCGEGLLVSNEINRERSKILSQNIERLGIDYAIVTNMDSASLAAHFPLYFHAIAVDAPCSGEGMFRKNPEALLEWSPENVTLCAKRQMEILCNAATMLLPGGRMVYSTCTFSPEENEEIVRAFLANHPELSLVDIDAAYFDKAYGIETGAFRIWPHKVHGEGHFVALFEKADTREKKPDEKEGKGKNKKNAGVKGKAEQEARLVFLEFAQKALTKECIDRLMRRELVLLGEQLYVLPEAYEGNATSLRGVKLLRAGLHLGELKKGRLEPAHALAMTLGTEDVKQVVDLSSEDPQVAAYLRGESVQIADANIAGWTLVCVDGFAIGWGKTNRTQVKNHYPKGLRKI